MIFPIKTSVGAILAVHGTHSPHFVYHDRHPSTDNIMKSTLTSLLLSLTVCLGLQPIALAVEPTPTNRAVTHHWSGEYRSETIATGERRGSEKFDLLIHPDGSRTISIASDMTTRNAWFTVMLRNDANFRPLEASAFYWNGGRYKGSGHFVVISDRVRGESNGPVSGVNTSELTVPARFSIGLHPVSADGWHTAQHDPNGDPRQTISLYSVEASSDLTKPVLGSLVPLEIEFVGEETIEVPAGRFETRRYRLAGMNDLWVYGNERIVVRSDLPARGLRYVLTKLSDSAQPPRD